MQRENILKDNAKTRKQVSALHQLGSKKEPIPLYSVTQD